MKLKKDDGVSPMIGTIILVAIAVVLIAIISAVIMGMCGVGVTEQPTSSDAPRIAEYPSDGIRIFVDPVTGVNYMTIYYIDGICPRYNADGSLYVSEVS